jgi:hypothetical protein
MTYEAGCRRWCRESLGLLLILRCSILGMAYGADYVLGVELADVCLVLVLAMEDDRW